MSELKPCPFCGREAIKNENVKYSPNETLYGCGNDECVCSEMSWATYNQWNTRPIEDALRAELERRTAELHYANTACMEMKRELDRLNAEIKTTDDLLKEATETIGAVIACCTYNSNDDAKIGIYGIDEKAFTKIDQFITHYNDAVSTGKVSIDVKRDLSDAEIEELGARAAESKQFCPNCEAETPCTHEAELYVCDICGEDFAKYIVSRNCNVSDVSMTQDVLTDIKTPPFIENNNPDYYKDELYLDEDFRMLAKTYPADVSAIGVTALIDYVEALEAELAALKAERRWIPVSERLIPGEGEVVLGYVDKSHLPTMVMFFEGEFVLVKSNKAPYERITHWMPLPEPPSEEEC